MKIRMVPTTSAVTLAAGFIIITAMAGCAKTSAAAKSVSDTTAGAAAGAMGAAKESMSATSDMAKKMTQAPYYAEEMKDGRIIVFGSAEAHQEFKTAGGVPEIRRTLIGGGPKGETVYIEADKKGDMADRLHMAFKAKHGM